jgi:hypothetical protein
MTNLLNPSIVFYFGLFELIFIIILLSIIRHQAKKLRIVKDNSQPSKPATGGDLFDNITKSAELVKAIRVDLHESKFIHQPDKQTQSSELLSRVGQKERAYRHLIQMMKEAETKGFEMKKSRAVLEKHKSEEPGNTIQSD